MTDQNEREPGALDMWRARQGVVISGIAVDRAHRTEVDLARAEVERLSVEVAKLTADRDDWCQLWTELGRGNRALAAEVADLTAERDRVRADLQMVRSQRDEAWAERCERVAWGEEGWRLAGNNAQLIDRLTEERDQALYERDQCREAVEFSRGLIPTRPR